MGYTAILGFVIMGVGGGVIGGGLAALAVGSISAAPVFATPSIRVRSSNRGDGDSSCALGKMRLSPCLVV